MGGERNVKLLLRVCMCVCESERKSVAVEKNKFLVFGGGVGCFHHGRDRNYWQHSRGGRSGLSGQVRA